MNHERFVGALHQVALPSSSLDRSISFYRDLLGLTLIARFNPPGLAFFQLGEVRLLLEHADTREPSSSVVYLQVRDIRHAHKTLTARGVNFSSEPHLIHTDDHGTFGEPGAQEWMAFFDDPDKNTLALAWRGTDPPAA